MSRFHLRFDVRIFWLSFRWLFVKLNTVVGIDLAEFYPFMRVFEYIDHTGDLGIRVRGKTLRELFTHAAHALFDTVAVLDTINPVAPFQIDVGAESVAELMVAWLDELNFRHEVDEVFFKYVEILELSETCLSALAYGEPRGFYQACCIHRNQECNVSPTECSSVL